MTETVGLEPIPSANAERASLIREFIVETACRIIDGQFTLFTNPVRGAGP